MAAVSKEEDQCIRLEKLIDLGTKALRHKFDILLPPDKLQKLLETFKPYITHRISRQENDRLYPQGGAPVTSDDMDLTTLVRVLRNTVLDEPLTGFGCLPQDSDFSFAADVVRIIFTRNKLYHTDFGTLKDHECQNMSRTLIEVINRLGESGFDDKIRHIMTGSLDYRAGSITWHAQEAMTLVLNAFKERVLQPAKASVIQLNEQQPLYYTIVGGAVVSYGMQHISKIQSREELIYYLHVLQNDVVRQCIFVLNKYPFLRQNLAQLILYQGKQGSSPNDKTYADVRSEVNTPIPGSILVSNSTRNSDFPGLSLQFGHVKHVSLPFSSSCTMDSPNKNYKLFKEQHLYNQPQYKTNKMVYNKAIKQDNSVSYSHCINVSGSTNSTTKIESSHFSRSYVENNVDVTYQIKQKCVITSSSQSSRIYLCCPHAHHDFFTKNAEMVYVCSLNRSRQTATVCYARDQTNYLPKSVMNVTQTDFNENVCGQLEPVPKNKNDPPNVFCDLKRYFLSMILIFVSFIIVGIIHENMCAIFKSKLHARILTIIIVLFYLEFIYSFLYEIEDLDWAFLKGN